MTNVDSSLIGFVVEIRDLRAVCGEDIAGLTFDSRLNAFRMLL